MARTYTDLWAARSTPSSPSKTYSDLWASRRPSAPSPPSTPSISGVSNALNAQLENAYQNIMSQYRPRTPNLRDIPTFDADYYMPQNTLRQINQLLEADPSYDRRQLQQRAQTHTNLVTNPQIETLRQQINAFKSLIPQTQRALQQTYQDANRRIGESSQDLIMQAVQAAQRQGGLRSGVYDELQRRAQEIARPLYDALEADRQANLEQTIGALEAEKQNAQNLLDTIERNRENMTEDQFNALRDQAIQQWRMAQQQQLQFLQGIAAIEGGARTSAAQFQQQAAADYNAYQMQSAQQYNQFLSDMIERQLQGLTPLQEQLQAQMQQQLQRNISRWQDYLTGPHVRTASDARRLLQENRNEIIASVGQDGYRELQRAIENFAPGGQNPNYRPPYPTTATLDTINSTRSSSPPGTYDNVGVSPWLGNIINALVPKSPPGISNPIAMLLRR